MPQYATIYVVEIIQRRVIIQERFPKNRAANFIFTLVTTSLQEG